MTTLFDSNVLVAAAITGHADRAAALPALANGAGSVAIHSLSEVYNTLTKARPYARDPSIAAAIVSQFANAMSVVGLTHEEHLAAIRRFAALRGVGARLYDFLIGETARKASLRIVVTLNAKHFLPLFPDLQILTPSQYLETL